MAGKEGGAFGVKETEPGRAFLHFSGMDTGVLDEAGNTGEAVLPAARRPPCPFALTRPGRCPITRFFEARHVRIAR